VNDKPSTPVTQRRTFIFGALGAAALGFVGLNFKSRHDFTLPSEPGDLGQVKATVLVFIGAMFGRALVGEDRADMSDRLDLYFASGAALRHEGAVLARYLDDQAQTRAGAAFVSCSEPQQQAIVTQVMTIDPGSLKARVLSRLSSSQRDHYRMRWSIVSTLARLYRHSAAAWRARGYTRWPGVPGDWHDVLAPGAPYP
jgi:hypothetical protein